MAGPRIYLDHNASAPVRHAVLEAVRDALREGLGNSSSLHRDGASARYRLEKARRTLIRVLGIKETFDLHFTSGGTESCALGVIGGALGALRRGSARHVVISAVEHEAVRAAAQHLREFHGFEVDEVPVDGEGRIVLDHLRQALRLDTALVSIIAAHNETGALQHILPLSALVRQHSNAVFHTDAVQWAGKLHLRLETRGPNLVSICGHKFGGPPGIGLLAVRRGIGVVPLASGGGQEAGLRGGTENVPGAVGMAAALAAAAEGIQSEADRQAQLREFLWKRISQELPQAIRITPKQMTLPNTLLIAFPGAKGRDLVMELDRRGYAVSSTSACHSAGSAPSRSLLAMGVAPALAAGAVRFSMGPGTSTRDLELLAPLLGQILKRPPARSYAEPAGD